MVNNFNIELQKIKIRWHSWSLIEFPKKPSPKNYFYRATYVLLC